MGGTAEVCTGERTVQIAGPAHVGNGHPPTSSGLLCLVRVLLGRSLMLLDKPTPGIVHMARKALVATLLVSLTVMAPRAVSAQPRTGHAASAPFVDQGTFTLVADDLASDIDPASNESEFGDTVIRNIDEDLIRLAGATLSSYEPDLAVSWSSNTAKSV